MCVVIEFSRVEGMGVESDGVNISVGSPRREDCGEHIVRSVSFHNQFGIRDPLSKKRSMSKLLFQNFEGGTANVPNFQVACLWVSRVRGMTISE